MTRSEWAELSDSLSDGFKHTHSIAEWQCALMAGGGVTPPKKCQARLEAALSGQLTPIIQSLEKASKAAALPMPGGQPDSAAPRTWEAVSPCKWQLEVEDGTEGEAVGGVVGGVLGEVVGGSVGPSGDVLPFGAGMTRPEKLSGPMPQYTPEALEARVQGLVIAKCVITTEGTLEQCRIIKPLPHLEQAVLKALYASRYKPVTYQGRPVAVDYTFNFKLTLPKPAPAQVP